MIIDERKSQTYQFKAKCLGELNRISKVIFFTRFFLQIVIKKAFRSSNIIYPTFGIFFYIKNPIMILKIIRIPLYLMLEAIFYGFNPCELFFNLKKAYYEKGRS